MTEKVEPLRMMNVTTQDAERRHIKNAVNLYFARCMECFQFTICEAGLPGGPAICEHPSSDYQFTWIAYRRMSGYVPTSFGEFSSSATDSTGSTDA